MESRAFKDWAESILDESTREVAKELCRQFEKAQAEKERTLVEAAELRSENRRLRMELSELSPSGGPVEGARGASPWLRWTQALLNKQELRRNVDSVQSQLQKLGEDEGDALLAWVPEMLSQDHVLVDVSQAYSSLGAAMQRRRTALWKAVAAGMRTHMVWLWACAGGCGFEAFDAALAELFGERYHANGPDPNFRSQFCGAFRQLFPGERRAKRRSTRSRQPDRNGPQRSASSSPEPHSAEEPEGEATPRAKRVGDALEDVIFDAALKRSMLEVSSGSEAAAEAGTPLPVGLVQRERPTHDASNHSCTFADMSDEQDEAASCTSRAMTFPLVKLTDKKAECKAQRQLERLIGMASSTDEDAATHAANHAHRIEELYETHRGLPEARSSLVTATVKHASNKTASKYLLKAIWYEVKHEPLSFEQVRMLLEEFVRQGDHWAVEDLLWHFEKNVEDCRWHFESQPGLANNVLKVMLETMAAMPEHDEVQLKALEVMSSVGRAQERVLGIQSSQEELFEAELLVEQEQIRAAAEAAAERHESCRDVAVRVLARTQKLDVVQAVAGRLRVTVPMDEINYHLEERVKTLFDDDESVQVGQLKWAKDIAKRIHAQQLGERLVHMEDLQRFLTLSNYTEVMQCRVLVSGLLSGAQAGILEPLTVTMDSIPHSTGTWWDASSMDLVESFFRAVWVFHDYVEELAPETRDMANGRAMAVSSNVDNHSQDGCVPCPTYVVSAVAGAIGSLNRGRGRKCGQVLQHLLNLAEDHMARWWEVKSFHYEVLWAVDQIFQGAALGEWEEQVCNLAVRLYRKWGRAQQKCKQDREEAKVLELATKILSDRFFCYAKEKTGVVFNSLIKQKVAAFVWTS